MNWFKVAGGGGTSTGDVYTVSGTFGQHDAGGPMQGGGFSVMSGFWSPLAVPAFNPAGTAPLIYSGPGLYFSNTSLAVFSASISGTNPIFLQWQKNGVNIPDATNSSLSLNLATSTYPGNYQLFVVSPYGSVASSPLFVSLFYAPTILTQPHSISNSVGSSGYIDVYADGNPSPHYQWYLNGVPVGGNNSSVYYSQLVFNSTYQVVVTNYFGSVVSNPAGVTVTNASAPAIQVQPQSVTNVIGSHISFSVSATGNPAPLYQWRLNGTNIIGANAATYNFLGTNAGNYDVVLTNYYGSVTSSVASLTVTNGGFAPGILALPQSRTNVVGTMASFSVSASGNPPPDYQWRLNGSPIYAIGSTYSFTASTSGSYDVVVANYYGSITSSVAVLTVVPLTQTGDFSVFQAASVVVGQTNFTSQDITASQVVTPGPTSVAISSQGKMAVGEQSTVPYQGAGRVLIWNNIPTSNGTPANVVVGQASFTATATGTTAAQCSQVEGVTFSPDGTKLLVCDAGNNRVLIWNTVPTSSGQPANVVIGQTDFTTSTGGTAANKLQYPSGVLVTPTGKLVIADNFNHRVIIFNSIPTVNNASADVVIGQPNMTTAISSNAANQMNTPWHCAYSSGGKLLVTEEGNNRVLVFNSLPTANGVAADVVIGQTDFGLSGAGTTANNCNAPIGVAISPSGALAIGEFENNRVLIFNSVPTVNGAAADTVLGEPDFTTATYFTYLGVNTVNSNSMASAYQVAFAADGRLLVSGRDMHRVMIFNKSIYNRITATPLTGGDMRLSYLGIAGTNYALDRTFNLTPVINWVPQITNPAGAGGVLLFTNTPVPTTNNFWRIRSVP